MLNWTKSISIIEVHEQLELKPLPSEDEHSVWQTEAHSYRYYMYVSIFFPDRNGRLNFLPCTGKITCQNQEIIWDIWFCWHFMILILLTFYDPILLFRILLRANEKEFRVHMLIRSVFECSHLSVSTRCSIYRLGICTGWHSV